MEKIRKHFVVTGRVQGVGFRYRARHIARMLGLTGWVRNEWDGSVEMEIQGDRDSLQMMLSMLEQQRFIWIESIRDTVIPLEEESSFRIR